MTKLNILLLNNHPTESGNPGQADGLRILSRRGEIGQVSVVNLGPRSGETQTDRDQRCVEAIRLSKADVILALSLKDQVRDVEAVQGSIAGRPLLYWEGDAWGRGKPVSAAMGAWLEMSMYVFSVGGPPQAAILQRSGAGTVHHTIHTYDHVLFGSSEQGHFAHPDRQVVFLGSQLARLPLAGGLPGSNGRRRLVASLKRRYGNELLVGGAGWPSRWNTQRVPFDQQDKFIQRARLLANWDHYPRHESYTSDRLAIAMIAGRAQVSTLHPSMQWAPAGEEGVFLEKSVARALKRIRSLLGLPQEELAALGRAAHLWAKGRLSHREAVRNMLSTAFPEIERPPHDPWGRLPGPWLALPPKLSTVAGT